MIRRNRYKLSKPIKTWTKSKPQLPMKTTLTCRVHFLDLQEYLAVVFRIQNYDIRFNTGSRAEMTPEFIVTGILPNTPNIEQQIENIRHGYKEHNLGLIMNLLCKDGFIPVGKYIIDMHESANPLDKYRDALYRTNNPFGVECMEIKAANKKDRGFIKQATMLDKRVMEYKSKLQSESIDD